MPSGKRWSPGTELEEELGSAVEQLAAAAAAAEAREAELQLGSQRLVEALEAVRSATGGLVSGSELPAGRADVTTQGRRTRSRRTRAWSLERGHRGRARRRAGGDAEAGTDRLLAVRPGPERLRAPPADGRAAAGGRDHRARPRRPGGADPVRGPAQRPHAPRRRHLRLSRAGLDQSAPKEARRETPITPQYANWRPAVVDYYFESDTTFDCEQRVEPGDEHDAAIETARSWELRYLDDAPLADRQRVRNARWAARSLRASAPLPSAATTATSASSSPKRLPSASRAFASISPAPSRSASSRPRRSLPCSTPRRWLPCLPATTPTRTGGTPPRPSGDGRSSACSAPSTPRRRGFRICAASCSSSAARWPRGRRACRSSRRSSSGCSVERLRDQEAVDRMRHDLSDRDNRLERALAKTQELAAMIQGGRLQ